MPLDLDSICIEPLNDLHERHRFRCTNGPIQNFCCGGLADAHRARTLRAYVGRDANSQEVLGYYYLTLTSVEHANVTQGVGDQFVHLDKIPAVYLGTIGVHQDFARDGLGTMLMFHAFRQVDEIADRAGAWALVLDAVDEDAVTYYERFDFVRFSPNGLEMYLPIGTIRQVIDDLDDAETDGAAGEEGPA